MVRRDGRARIPGARRVRGRAASATRSAESGIGASAIASASVSVFVGSASIFKNESPTRTVTRS
jgi:hypothetical protein